MSADSMSNDNSTPPSSNASRAPIYGRIVLKLSGESFQGPQGFGLDAETVHGIAREVKEVNDLGVQTAIIVGGGNIFRGTRQKSLSIDRATGYYMGNDVLAGERPQAVVPGQAWQSARSLGAWTLVGCTVAPAFEFERFELAPIGWAPAQLSARPARLNATNLDT